MKNPKSPERLDYLWRLFDQTRRAMWKVWNRELHKLGIHTGQVAILNVLQDLEDSNFRLIPTNIAHVIFVEPHAVSQMLDRMKNLGLINKTNDEERRNVINVTLTVEGRTLAEKLTEIRSEENIMACLSPEELESFESILLKLRDESIRILRINHEVPLPPRTD